jgi:hypothetical protein
MFEKSLLWRPLLFGRRKANSKKKKLVILNSLMNAD